MTSTPSTPPLPQVPGAPPPPPMFGQNAAQKKPKQQSMNPTFLGTGDIPSNQGAGKTLLGQ